MYFSSVMAIILFFLLFTSFIFAQIKKVSFNLRAISALFIGLSFGLSVRLFFINHNSTIELVAILNFIGNIYIKLLIMLIIPLVFTSIAQSIINLRSSNGIYLTKIAVKTIIFLLLTTGVSAIIGSFIAKNFNLGMGLHIPGINIKQLHQSEGILSTILAMFPSNPIKAMVDNNIIAVVIFSVLIGIATVKLYKERGEIAQPFIGFIDASFLVSKKMANMIISLTPYGVMSLMAHMSLTQGWGVLQQMVTFMLAMYLAMFIVICLHIFLLLLVGVNPLSYFKKVYPALLVAFTTRSSLGTMPVTMNVLRSKLKLSESVSNFVPSIGSTIGMNACAGIYPAMLVVMTLIILGMPVTWKLIFFIAIINMIASLGVSGIPGTAFVAAGVVLSTLGLPYSIVALVQGIDPVIDMGRTATNINAVMTTAVLVDRSTKV